MYGKVVHSETSYRDSTDNTCISASYLIPFYYLLQTIWRKSDLNLRSPETRLLAWAMERKRDSTDCNSKRFLSCLWRPDGQATHKDSFLKDTGDIFSGLRQPVMSWIEWQQVPPNITDINLLNPTGHLMHQQFNIQQLYVLPTLHLCVMYLSENKQRLVPLTA